MRESFGGAFMIKLVLVFIVIYVSFMAVAVNYAKTFRVKNGVMNILEQNQFDGKDSNVINKVDEYLSSFSYMINQDTNLKSQCENSTTGAIYTQNGACIEPRGEGTNRYYKVTTYIVIDFPFFNIHLTLPISGETEAIGDWRKVE